MHTLNDIVYSISHTLNKIVIIYFGHIKHNIVYSVYDEQNNIVDFGWFEPKVTLGFTQTVWTPTIGYYKLNEMSCSTLYNLYKTVWFIFFLFIFHNIFYDGIHNQNHFTW